MKIFKRIIKWGMLLLFIGILSTLLINAHVKKRGKSHLISIEEATQQEDIDCILVLGCLVRPDGNPSLMLEDRLECGVELYYAGASSKMIMSGDHGQTDYDEVNAMKQYAIDEGIPSEDVFMDHAGFSTYESIYRAKEIFGADKILIVSQEYHLYRALYIAEKLGVEAYGVAAEDVVYAGQNIRDFREVLARVKDAITVIFKPKPTYLGETISVDGDGNVTND